MMTDLESLSERAATGDGRGGRRPGAGRKRKDGSQPTKKIPEVDFDIRSVEDLLGDGPPPPLVPPPRHSNDVGAIDLVMPDNPVSLYAGAKARKEAALAAKAELDFRIKAGQYLPREAVRGAIAKIFQSLAQSLRSIPDNLERKLGIPSEVSEQVGISIDEAMGDLAIELEQIHTQHYAVSSAD